MSCVLKIIPLVELPSEMCNTPFELEKGYRAYRETTALFSVYKNTPSYLGFSFLNRDFKAVKKTSLDYMNTRVCIIQSAKQFISELPRQFVNIPSASLSASVTSGLCPEAELQSSSGTQATGR